MLIYCKNSIIVKITLSRLGKNKLFIFIKFLWDNDIEIGSYLVTNRVFCPYLCNHGTTASCVPMAQLRFVNFLSTSLLEESNLIFLNPALYYIYFLTYRPIHYIVNQTKL